MKALLHFWCNVFWGLFIKGKDRRGEKERACEKPEIEEAPNTNETVEQMVKEKTTK